MHPGQNMTIWCYRKHQLQSLDVEIKKMKSNTNYLFNNYIFIFDEERKRRFQFDLFEQECRNSDKRENSTKHSASVLERPYPYPLIRQLRIRLP